CQVEMDSESKEKTAFICNTGLFEFNIMHFGLCNAPATFQRMIDEIVGEMGVGLDYLDDAIIELEDFEKHLQDIRCLFDVFWKHKLSMKFNKCKFLQQELIHLKHVLSKDVIKPNPAKVKIIQEMIPLT